ncbi:alpha/beta family hydrolase [Spongisporangium articulatum]|uniref:Alpha/beta family hydrolase n=1 Tax=Spongisporangium articulatum TaxID=3362603 RepID=A0ABW8APR7_9ACTN
MPEPELLDAETPLGPGRFHLSWPGASSTGVLVVGHGAGGGVGATDIVAARQAAYELGWVVALYEQPWKVAGGRVAPAPPRLDVGWLAGMETLTTALGERGITTAADGVPLVLGGRSAGARVACRTAEQLGAAGVLCLAFPLHPPGRPEKSRAFELLGAGVPRLVVQGERDPFGRPEEYGEVLAEANGGVRLVPVPGDHSLRSAPPVRAAVGEWLGSLPGMLRRGSVL